VVTHPLPATIGLDAGEHVEAGLKPVIERLRDFQGLVLGVVAGQNPVFHRLAAVRGEV